MLKTGIGILQIRTKDYPTFIRNSQSPFACLIPCRFLAYTAISLDSAHVPTDPFVKRSTARPQWKRSILDNLDVSNRKTKGVPAPPHDPKLSNLLQKVVPDESSDTSPFSPLPVRLDLEHGPDASCSDLIEEPLIDDLSKIPDVPDVQIEEPEVEDLPDERTYLLQIIRDNTTLEDSWKAYTRLLHLQKSYGNNLPVTPFIPHHYLHFLSSQLAKIQAAGRRHFFRFLSVLTSLRTSGGTIFDWEWNSLIHCSAKSYRKTTVEDYRIAIGIFKDMVNSASIVEKELRQSAGIGSEDALPDELEKTIARPDAVTYATLLAIASRTGNPTAVQHAQSMLNASGQPWIPRAYSAMLPYYMSTNQLDAFPRVVAASFPNDMTIILVTQIIWAYAFKGRLRIAMQIYEFLRGNIPPEDKMSIDEPSQGSFGLEWRKTFNSDETEGNPILSLPGFIDHATMPPNGITYCTLIQALCYHGDLIGAITIFKDMLSTIRTSDRPTHIREFYKPRPSIYRSFFLGFARHAGGNGIRKPLSQSLMARDYEMDQIPLPEFAARLTATPRDLTTMAPLKNFTIDSPWTLENLEIIFENFLEMDWDACNAEEEKAPTLKLSDRTIYWIMVSFAKTTNNDWYKMYTVWTRLDNHMDFSQYSLSKRLRDMRDYLVGRFGHVNVTKKNVVGERVSSSGSDT